MRRAIAPTVLSAALVLLAACTPRVQAPGAARATPALSEDAIVTADGARLPLKVWRARGRLRAVILALHGMNDHKGSFALPAATWRERGITVYAYDQRGFGAAPFPGIWPGVRLMLSDFRTAVALVRARHPDIPLYVLGVSMGGAVALATLGRPDAPKVSGAILAAPAVWARKTMPRVYQIALHMAARAMPWAHMSAGDLGRRPTDNIPLWRAASRHPLMISSARIDAVFGVTNLMDAAWAAAPRVRAPVLFLYGANDEIIPKEPVAKLLTRLPAARRRFAYYRKGWHWLFRDLNRVDVHDDVSTWVLKRVPPGSPPTAPGRLPSGADRQAMERLNRDIEP